MDFKLGHYRNSTYRIKAFTAASLPLRVAAQLLRCASMCARKSRINGASICSRQICDGLIARRRAGEDEQEPKRVGIGLAGMRAAALFGRHVL